MPEIKVNGIRLNYQITGKGPDMVLLHGLTVDQRMWDQQVADFSKDFRVITYDLRGHGKSEAPVTGYSVEDHIEDLYQLLKHLNVSKAHLVGRSIGAPTVFGFALRHPEMVESLVLANGAPSNGPPPAGASGGGPGGPQIATLAKQGRMKEAMDLWLQIPAFSRVAQIPQVWGKLKPMLLEYRGATWLDPKAGAYPIPNDVEKAGQIKAPALFVFSEHETGPVATCEKAMSLMPNARKTVIANAGALSNLEQPESFNKALRAFYSSTKAGAKPRS